MFYEGLTRNLDLVTWLLSEYYLLFLLHNISFKERNLKQRAIHQPKYFLIKKVIFTLEMILHEVAVDGIVKDSEKCLNI